MDKNDFLKPTIVKTKEVPLPDGSKVYVRKLSQGDTETVTNDYAKKGLNVEGMRFITNKALCAEDGTRIFDDKDLAAMKSMDFDIVKTVSDAATDFSGMARAEAKKPSPSDDTMS